MSVSSPFIRRPIATSLLGVAAMLGGLLGYLWLPVSSLPQVDFPTIQVTTQLPGASPDVMTALVTAPLERNFGQIPSLQLMTSSSSFGISQITLQFDLGREIDAAAQDVQAAINASGSALPRNLPRPLVLSGGLNATNVGEAIRRMRPWAVDVSSGVEASAADGKTIRGTKDPARIAAFIEEVRNADD